jgi:hypothetical protein
VRLRFCSAGGPPASEYLFRILMNFLNVVNVISLILIPSISRRDAGGTNLR